MHLYCCVSKHEWITPGLPISIQLVQKKTETLQALCAKYVTTAEKQILLWIMSAWYTLYFLVMTISEPVKQNKNSAPVTYCLTFPFLGSYVLAARLSSQLHQVSLFLFQIYSHTMSSSADTSPKVIFDQDKFMVEFDVQDYSPKV